MSRLHKFYAPMVSRKVIMLFKFTFLITISYYFCLRHTSSSHTILYFSSKRVLPFCLYFHGILYFSPKIPSLAYGRPKASYSLRPRSNTP